MKKLFLLFTYCLLFFLNGFTQVDFGVIQSINKDTVLYANGYRFIEESIGNSFSPRSVNEVQFKKNLERFRQSKIKLYSCNIFIPGQLKLVGPAVNDVAVLGYVDTVLQRCKQAGVQLIVLGSGEARRIPAGYDSIKASKEFILLVRKMADLSAGYGITIAIENLNHKETNFVLSISQALDIVKAVNRPFFKLTADVYHMLVEDEPADVLLQASKLLVHCHIAEEIDRAYPGKTGVDFRPYFSAMKKMGYTGKIMIECRWNDVDRESLIARKYLLDQWNEAK